MGNHRYWERPGTLELRLEVADEVELVGTPPREERATEFEKLLWTRYDLNQNFEQQVDMYFARKFRILEWGTKGHLKGALKADFGQHHVNLNMKRDS